MTDRMPVGDFGQATAWDGGLLDASPEIAPAAGVLEYEVHAGSRLQISGGDRSAGGAVGRFGVRDIERARGRLRDHGGVAGEIARGKGGIAFLDLRDPQRNRLS